MTITNPTPMCGVGARRAVDAPTRLTLARERGLAFAASDAGHLLAGERRVA